MRIRIFEGAHSPVITVDGVKIERVTSINTSVAVGQVPTVTVSLLPIDLDFDSTRADLILRVGGQKFRVLEMLK